MAVCVWLLLSLMAMQTAAGRDVHGRRNFKDAPDTLISESVDRRTFAAG